MFAQPRPFRLQYLPVQKQNRAERLVLGCRGNPVPGRERGEKALHVLRPELPRAAAAVVHDIAANPVQVSPLGPQAHVPRAHEAPASGKQAAARSRIHEGALGRIGRIV